MNELFLKTYVKALTLLNRDEGQDLIEYALLLTMICLALITGINGIAKSINITFSSISSSLS